MLLVDESRLTYGADPAVAGVAGASTVVGPATFLEGAIALRVVSDGERRAIVRRIAATRPELQIPEHVRRSPSFARRVLEAIDRGSETAFAELAGEYRTLLAFANAVDAREGLQRALAAGTVAAGVTAVRIDALLLGGEHAFGWRRLAALGNFTLEPCELAPFVAPLLDRAGVAALIAFLRYAASESDADARAALRSKLAPIDPGDARLLLATAGEAANVLDVIDAGAAGGGREFAHALRTIARAYRVPDSGAADVVDTAARVLGLDPATHDAVMRIARDFDRARLLAPAWEAADIIDEFAAELDGIGQPPTVAPGSPAPLAAPQPGVPFETRRSTFSASSLNTYAECARKWYFRYVCAAVEDRGSSASFYGTAFHAALEDFHGTHTRFDGKDAGALGSFLDYCIVVAFDRHRTRFDAAVEFELQKRRARRTGKRYVAWLLERARRAPFEVIGCETSTDVRLDGLPFVGFIDRLDRDDATGEVTVVDYKTGSIATSGAEYLAEVLAFREFQLPFYYWARTAAGDRVTRLALVPLKDALLDVEPIELLVAPQRPRATPRGGTSATIGVDDLERARERMIAIARTLSSPVTAHFPATDDPDACRYCAYQSSCRERPVVAEERFGR